MVVSPDDHSEDRTQRIGDSVADAPTQRVAEVPVGRARNMSSGPANGRPARPLGYLNEGDVLAGSFTVIETIHPHETTLAGIYHCKQDDESSVVVKVAAAERAPKLDLWRTLPAFEHPNVLRVLEVFELEGRFYEVQEFCSGGSMADRVVPPGGNGERPSADWIQQEFIPAASAGLNYLHGRGIVHRDIKPPNIYVRAAGDGTEKIVLGDFDISATLDTDRTSRHTSRMEGTWIYSAPETYPRAGRGARVDREADYYSLGVTIIELLMGTTSLHAASAELDDLFDFYLEGNRIEVPQSAPESLQILLSGLLRVKRDARWGESEVQRWIAGENTEEDLRKLKADDSLQVGVTSHLRAFSDSEGLLRASSLPELAAALIARPDVAERQLMTHDLMINWIGELDTAVATGVHADREEYRNQPPMAVWAAAVRCDPGIALPLVNGKAAASPGQWPGVTDALVAEKVASPAIASDNALERIAVWLERRKPADAAAAKQVRALKEAEKSPELRREALGWFFDPTRPYVVAGEVAASTPQEVAQLTYGGPDDWRNGTPQFYLQSFKRWQEGYLEAWMLAMGLTDHLRKAQAARVSMQESPGYAFETVLHMLDQSLPVPIVGIDRPALPLAASHGQRSTFELRYSTSGCGVPYGRLALVAGSGLALREHVLSGRNDVIRVLLDTTAGERVSTPHQAEIRLESGTAALAGGRTEFQYLITFPNQKTAKRVAIGALTGLLLLGAPRLLMTLMGMDTALALSHGLSEFMRVGLSPNAVQPGVIWLVGSVALGACGYGGYRVWLRAWSKAER